jgi:RNA 2',3'-cyclic 3'-phosphodiesterase
MRLFVAAEPSRAVRRAAADAVAALRAALEARRVGYGIRWIPSDNFHLTVWFLGELSDPRAEAVQDALRPPLDEPAFTLQISGFGAFPPSGSPRVIWLGVTKGLESLARVHAVVGRRLAPWGFQPEGRPYSAHLTVARIKNPPPGAERRVLRDVLGRIPGEAGSCRIDHLTVFRSRTSPTGAEYEPLVRVPLT